MDKKAVFLSGMAIGGALVFLLEPTAARRRAVVRDKAVSGSKRLGRFSRKTARDLGNRSRGLMAELRGRLREPRPTGRILAERVRSRLGRVVPNAGAIEVLTDAGRVPALQSRRSG